MYAAKKISTYIADCLQDAHIIAKEENVLYQYSLEHCLEQIFFGITVLLLGAVLHQFGLAVLFLLTFVPLRSVCGGAHAHSARACTVLSYSVTILFLLTVPMLASFNPIITDILFLLSYSVIWCASPVDTPNKRFTPDQRQRLKKYSRYLCAILTLFWSALTLFGARKYAAALSLCGAISALSLLAGLRSSSK